MVAVVAVKRVETAKLLKYSVKGPTVSSDFEKNANDISRRNTLTED